MVKPLNRREMATSSFAHLALASMLHAEYASGGAVSVLHHPPRARRVIQLFMGGAASHLDLWAWYGSFAL